MTKRDLKMRYRGIPHMQSVGRRLTREQHRALRQLRQEDGFESMDTQAFLSLLRLLHQSGGGGQAVGESDRFHYAIHRIHP